ncbi:hypothetical protein AAG570_007100 [Ranatra chinensis]|uniref:Molybdopterin synthase catalytic subunit n=1 Tax=Ranatra chinensis TaxID=642074 RepID=A0ABD0YDG4_9HEMI
MNRIKLVEDALDVGEIVESVKSPKCGAVSVFVGTTRDNFANNEVVHLSYEAYVPMAEKCIERVCDEMRRKWPDIENIAVHHRLGEVKVTEASIVIAVSSPHRSASLEAVNFAINSLKATVPIWKKEHYRNRNAKWKQNEECLWSEKAPVPE